MKFKVDYLRRYWRIIDMPNIQAAAEHMAAIAALYAYEDFRLLSIRDVMTLPTYADGVMNLESKEGIDMLPVIS